MLRLPPVADSGSEMLDTSRRHPKIVSSVLDLIGRERPDLVIFDFDGTMVYTEDIHWKNFHDAIAGQFGKVYPFSEHSKVTGFSYTAIWERLSRVYNFDPIKYPRPHFGGSSTADAVKALGRERYSYLSEALDAARKMGCVIGCVTANTSEAVLSLLSDWGLAGEFSFVYSTDVRGESKVEIVSRLREAFGGKAMMFEDSKKTLSLVKESLGGNVICVGIGHLQSFDMLMDCPGCDFLIDVRAESIPMSEAQL